MSAEQNAHGNKVNFRDIEQNGDASLCHHERAINKDSV